MGHPDLLQGFIHFLPLLLVVVDEEDHETVNRRIVADEAILFITRVQERLVHEPERYRNFLDIFHFYHQGELDIKEVQEQMFLVLTGHPDLLQEVIHFLPLHVQAVAQVQWDAMARDQQRP